MTDVKKNGLLLTCLLLILWLIAATVGCATLPIGNHDAASGNEAASSMSATDSGFDFLDPSSAVRMSPASGEVYRLQLAKTGLYAVITVMAVLFSVVLIRLKLCQAVFLPFNFNRIPAYIHKKDGMK